MKIEDLYHIDPRRPGEITIYLDPVPKPRMTQRDRMYTDPNHPDPAKRQRKGVAEYKAFKTQLQLIAKKTRLDLGGELKITFGISMPESWPKHKKEILCQNPHTQAPDIDNLVKAVLDCLCPKSDAHVHTILANKIWATTNRPFIQIQNHFL